MKEDNTHRCQVLTPSQEMAFATGTDFTSCEQFTWATLRKLPLSFLRFRITGTVCPNVCDTVSYSIYLSSQNYLTVPLMISISPQRLCHCFNSVKVLNNYRQLQKTHSEGIQILTVQMNYMISYVNQSLAWWHMP